MTGSIDLIDTVLPIHIFESLTVPWGQSTCCGLDVRRVVRPGPEIMSSDITGAYPLKRFQTVATDGGSIVTVPDGLVKATCAFCIAGWMERSFGRKGDKTKMSFSDAVLKGIKAAGIFARAEAEQTAILAEAAADISRILKVTVNITHMPDDQLVVVAKDCEIELAHCVVLGQLVRNDVGYPTRLYFFNGRSDMIIDGGLSFRNALCFILEKPEIAGKLLEFAKTVKRLSSDWVSDDDDE